MATVASETLILYHADWGRSCRAILLLRLLEVPFTLKIIEWMQIKDREFMATVSPLGRIPVLLDGEVHLYESGAMVEYLLYKYGPGKLTVPKDGRQHADFLQWFHTAEDTMMSAVAKVYICKVLPARRTPERLEEGTKAVQGILQMMENYLSTHHRGEWLAGPAFTAADIMMSYTLGLLTFTSQSPAEVPAILTADKYPVTVAYWDRLQDMPGYKDCYEDINLLPVGEHLIEPGKSFKDVTKRPPSIFWDIK